MVPLCNGAPVSGRRWRWRALLFSLCLVAAGNPGHAQSRDLLDLSIEELINIEVFSVTKTPESLQETAAAAFVITREDIRRAGATSIPEALRMAPGVQVAQIDANKWAISIRGFNSRLANKLLVLMDGRTLYTPLFSGIYWDVQDTLLEDVERIEVIRGPGGTLWGANAVNGIINIITRSSKDTTGTLVSVGAGSHERSGAARYGGALGQGHFRTWIKYFDRDGFETATGAESPDEWDALRGGFRIDRERPGGSTMTVQGDIYQGDSGQTAFSSSLAPPYFSATADTAKVSGGNLLARWTRRAASGAVWSLQTYYDSNRRSDATLGQTLDTLDLDFQHNFPGGGRHELAWGGGYRRIQDKVRNSFTVALTPEEDEAIDLWSAFVQDRIRLGEKVTVTLGAKLERNDYSGEEYQPSARFLWRAADAHSLWGGVSRAVRTPSRSDTNIRINVTGGPGPTLVSIFGNPALVAEELTAFELGYRGRPTHDLSVDLAAFVNVYDHLTTRESGFIAVEAVPAPPHSVTTLTFDNRMRGETYGFEANSSWQAFEHWRLHFGYAWLEMNLELAGSNDIGANRQVERSNPEHQVLLRSEWDIARRLELDGAVYHTTRLSGVGVPSNTRLDLRLGWHPRPRVEVSLVGRNLLDDRHPEFVADDVGSSQVPRTVFVQATWTH